MKTCHLLKAIINKTKAPPIKLIIINITKIYNHSIVVVNLKFGFAHNPNLAKYRNLNKTRYQSRVASA